MVNIGAQKPEVLAGWGSYGNWQVSLKRYLSRFHDAGCCRPGIANASSVFFRRMTPAFKQFQTIFLVRKAQFFSLSGPTGARFGVGRGECSFPGLSPAPFLEQQAFKNVRPVIVVKPGRKRDHDADLFQIVLATFSPAGATSSHAGISTREQTCEGHGAFAMTSSCADIWSEWSSC